MIGSLLTVSLSASVIIALALVLNAFIDKRYMARGKYIFWLLLSVRLLIPFNFTLPKAPVRIAAPERSVVLTPGNPVPASIMTETERRERLAADPAAEVNSAAYAKVMPLEALLTVIWLCGAATLLICRLVKYWLFKLSVRRRLSAAGEYKGLPLYRCGAIQSPMLTGFFRPMIFLPEVELTADELDVVLAHEYVHYRRRDLWYKLLLTAANALHWFNPLVYLMARQANRDLEYSCDDAVTRGRDMEFRKLYSMTVLKTMQRK